LCAISVVFVSSNSTDDFWRGSFAITSSGRDISSLTWQREPVASAVRPSARAHHACTASQGQLFLFGGQAPQVDKTDSLLNDFWYYKPDTLTWQRLYPKSSIGETPVARYGATLGTAGQGKTHGIIAVFLT
jgi:hypothetical protein